KLYNDNSSVARRAAFNLSWMQEDGLEILQEALFHGRSRRVKYAACYGLRNMHGRMKKAAYEVIRKGAESSTRDISEVCRAAVILLNRPASQKAKPKHRTAGRVQIREMRDNRQRRPISHTGTMHGRYNSDRGQRR
ncbi:MAG: hypothetical protein WC962_07950, partial [Phycisphaerae bacterium]